MLETHRERPHSVFLSIHILTVTDTHAFVSSEVGYATGMERFSVLEGQQEQAGGDNLEALSGELKLELN